MKMIQDPDHPLCTVPAKSAMGMISKEGEYVDFNSDFTCTGAVEGYLNDLEKKMRDSLRDILETAKNTAEHWGVEKDRHYWLEDYPAQISLLATQIVWTDETAKAFDELE